MILLGVNLPDTKLVKIALTSFHGIGHSTSKLICARLHLHDRMAISQLSEPQINALTSLLSAPGQFMATTSTPSSSSQSTSSSASIASISPTQAAREHARLANLLIETDLRKNVRENIAHHRTVGTYKGRRHAMGLTVRGQRTKTNAKMARRLNRVERKAFSTLVDRQWSEGREGREGREGQRRR